MQIRRPGPRSRGQGFTLTELLVVIAIISLLAGALVPVLMKAKGAALDTECMSNMKQLSTAIECYRIDDANQVYPMWLTQLLGDQIDGEMEEVFLCPKDFSDGAEGGVPDETWREEAGQFENVDRDGPHLAGFGNADTGDDPGTLDPMNNDDGGLNCSYAYEFSSYNCEWYSKAGFASDNGVADSDAMQDALDLDSNNRISWYEAKRAQVEGFRAGAQVINGMGLVVPVVRCFWHLPPFAENDDKFSFNILANYSFHKSYLYWEAEHGYEFP